MSKDFKPETAFEGYVFAKLESMDERLNELPCKEIDDRLRKCENNISNIQGKASILGAIAGFVTALLTKRF